MLGRLEGLTASEMRPRSAACASRMAPLSCDEPWQGQARERERPTSAFFISSSNPEADLQRCHESQRFLSRLVITGATEQGEIKLFEGVVQSIEDHGENAPTGRRWRVTMIDEP
jgi:hypothetical protein